MRKYIVIALLCAGLISARPVKGQGQRAAPAAEVFIGGSTLWETTALYSRFTNPGFDLSVTYNRNRFAGLETNVSAFGNHTPGSTVYVDRFRLLLGPHFAHNTNSRVSLFAHTLGGLTRGQKCTAGCYFYRYPPGPLASAQMGRTAFTAAVGGGVDVRIFRWFWFRPIQADYVHVFFPYNAGLGSSPENNLQMAFGFTIRLGSLGETDKH